MQALLSISLWFQEKIPSHSIYQGSPTFFTLQTGWGRWGIPALVCMREQAHTLSCTNECALMHMRKRQCSACAGAYALMHMCKRQHDACLGILALTAETVGQHLHGHAGACTDA